MASFNAYDFVYDGIPSHTFDLKIITFDDGGLFSGVGSSNVDILTQRVLRKSKLYYLGRIQQPVLEFPFTFGTAHELSGMDRDLISAWLFGRSGYKKLEVLQDDLNSAWFNCFMTEPEPQYIGGINYAFKCNVVCDSPFAYSPTKTIVTGSFAGESYDFSIYNHSSDDDYLYPVVEFTLSGANNFSLTNLTDNNRVFTFTGLLSTETITVDNDIQTVVTDSGINRLSKFNKNWFRLVPKINNLRVTSSISNLEITYNERIKIGG